VNQVNSFALLIRTVQEIRLELDDSKLKTIITELDILHRATSPYIIDFYGAFFIESCVYYCMEFMDAGSLEVVAGIDVPEDVLARITRSMVEGLKFLKDGLKIMHRGESLFPRLLEAASEEELIENEGVNRRQTYKCFAESKWVCQTV